MRGKEGKRKRRSRRANGREEERSKRAEGGRKRRDGVGRKVKAGVKEEKEE